MDDDIEIAKVVEVEHKSDSSLVKMDINDNLEKREDEAFNREFDIGYNCVVLHKHPNIDTKGVYYKILNSPDEKFQDIEKYPFFETNEQWNLIPNLESGKTYVFFKKGKNDLISPHYAKIRLLAKPSSIKDIYETFNATYEEFFKLNLHRNLKNMGINKLNIGVVGHSGEGKSVLISSLITILDTQNNDNTKTKINFAFSNPEKKKIIPSKDPPKKHQNIDKINLLEFPQYFQNVDSDPMEDQYKNDLISCHAIILTIKWETVRNLNLAIRYQKCDEVESFYF